MKTFTVVVTSLVCLIATATTVQARDTRQRFDVAPVLEKYADRLEGVRFYFGEQVHPKPAATMGEWQSNKKTNAFNKSDREACEWALLSALLSLKERAMSEGGNAVIDIWSNYKSNRFDSNSQYECGAGAIMAGVTLKGTVAKIN